MSFNTFGKIFRFTTWGESHGPAIGCVIDGCPPNIHLKGYSKDMDRRTRTVQIYYSKKRSDKVNILSGVFEGKTTGTPISIIIHNEDKKSRDYESIKNKFRPGMLIILILKNMASEILEVVKTICKRNSLQVAAGAVAKIVLKKIIGIKFNIIGAVTQLGLMSVIKNWKTLISEKILFSALINNL